MTPLPLVSIVTPSLNAAHYVERSIRSVLNQDYPHIEYLVIDGGSIDETVQIASLYSHSLQFTSEKDSGPAEAVNRGFGRSRGEIFGFLNADDVYYPGAISAVVDAFLSNPNAAVVYGAANWIDERDRVIAPYPVEDFALSRLGKTCYICQPAAFIRAAPFRDVNGLDASLQFAFDHELWIRLAHQYSMVRIQQLIAGSRMHAANKTLGQRQASFREILQVVHRHFGYAPLDLVYGYCHAVTSGHDLFFSAPKPSPITSIMAAGLGLRLNWRHPVRWIAEILRAITEHGGQQ